MNVRDFNKNQVFLNRFKKYVWNCRIRRKQTSHVKMNFREVKIMTKKAKVIKEIKIERPERMKLSAEESLKRTKEFDKRKEKFIATIRQGKG